MWSGANKRARARKSRARRWIAAAAARLSRRLAEFECARCGLSARPQAAAAAAGRSPANYRALSTRHANKPPYSTLNHYGRLHQAHLFVGAIGAPDEASRSSSARPAAAAGPAAEATAPAEADNNCSRQGRATTTTNKMNADNHERPLIVRVATNNCCSAPADEARCEKADFCGHSQEAPTAERRAEREASSGAERGDERKVVSRGRRQTNSFIRRAADQTTSSAEQTREASFGSEQARPGASRCDEATSEATCGPTPTSEAASGGDSRDDADCGAENLKWRSRCSAAATATAAKSSSDVWLLLNTSEAESANQLSRRSRRLGAGSNCAIASAELERASRQQQQVEQQTESGDAEAGGCFSRASQVATTSIGSSSNGNGCCHDKPTTDNEAGSSSSAAAAAAAIEVVEVEERWLPSAIISHQSDRGSTKQDQTEEIGGDLCESQRARYQIQSQRAADGHDEENCRRVAETDGGLLFWSFLSDLPRSITQRGKSQPGSLAPEVAGYLVSRRRTCDAGASALEATDQPSAAAAGSGAAPSGSRPADTMRDQTDEEPRPPPYEGRADETGAAAARRLYQPATRQHGQHQHEMVAMNHLPAAAACERGHQPAGVSADQSRLVRIVAPRATDEPAQSASNRLNNQQRLQTTNRSKLSITSSRTTTRSSATSLSSCVLSDSSSASSGVVRLKWGKKMDFLLSIIGFAVDLANIWRFPYLVYKNGGGVFLIPYLTMLIFGGIPLFFLELCLGQFVKKGPITVWNKICPSMKGVGYCSIMISWYVSFYYNVLIAWSVYFIYRSLLSFGDKMPWEDCDNSWNSKGTCVSISQLKESCSHKNVSLETCRKDLFDNVNVTSPASEFFVKELSQIDQSTGLDDMGYLRWELVFCTMIVYMLHYFSLFRGLETSGKVVWVTATAPYMILSILLVRGLFLPGATMGIKYYLSPKLEKLADPQVWIDAAGQVFYSIGVGFGVHLTYASFNSHNNNCYRDCLMTSAVNAATSVYSGLVVFVYLGYMAKNLGIEIDKVASEGYSLVFEVYPEALTTLPFARFWSILFFIMLLTLGIDSAMGGLEAVITGLEDEFRFARRLSRGQLTGLVIVSSFLPALISCTQGGAYTLFWFDIYSAGVSLLFSALFETIGVVYCYGLSKFIPNIESMLGRKPPLFYILCWKYISPIFLGGVIFMSIYTAGVPTYRGYTFPLWSIILGWCLAFSSVAAIPIVAAWYWIKRWFWGSALDKSGRRRDRGSSSVASSRHGSSKKSPSHRSVSVSCGLQSQGGPTSQTTTSVLAKSPNESKHDKYHHRGLVDSIEDML